MEDRERLDVSLCLFIIYYFFVFFAITACGKTVIINKILDKNKFLMTEKKHQLGKICFLVCNFRIYVICNFGPILRGKLSEE